MDHVDMIEPGPNALADHLTDQALPEAALVLQETPPGLPPGYRFVALPGGPVLVLPPRRAP